MRRFPSRATPQRPRPIPIDPKSNPLVPQWMKDKWEADHWCDFCNQEITGDVHTRADGWRDCCEGCCDVCASPDLTNS